ncbi:hypothetical protein AV521_21815 [Streptomyces sp. IMTB 2501]|nr:hypothetical protein AV521_21815 [Streptomyces sp. IMTB 2501]
MTWPSGRAWAQDAVRPARSRMSGWTDRGDEARPASARTPRSARRSASPRGMPRRAGSLGPRAGRIGSVIAMSTTCPAPVRSRAACAVSTA